MEDNQQVPVQQPQEPNINETKTETAPKRKINFLFFGIALLLIIIGSGAYFFLQNKKVQVPNLQTTDLHTYFSYTNDELKPLVSLKKSDHITTIDDLRQREEETYTLVAKNKTGDPSKLYTYLLVGRRDALLITQSMHKEFYGDTSPITKKIVCEFYPNNCTDIQITEENADPFSEQLAEIIVQKIKKRITEDNATTKDYELKNDPKLWYATPQLGRDAGSYKPWLIEKGDQFRVPENPEFVVQNFQKQLTQVKTALANITPEQRKAVIFWAGGPGTKTPPGIWLDIAGAYMIKNQAPVEKYLNTQALLSMAMTDSLTGCFDSKYTYQVKRPFMVDPTIKTVMPTPNHPSYPAGHACVSNSAATILNNMWSENTQEWNSLALEASDSRTWGGIHFPADNVQGTLLGKQVGEYAINRFNQL